MPAGLDTPVGERGGRLSAGERQLVALVRAWIADPALLVLDEATSAVDPALEVRLRRAIERLTGGRTSITVAHRLSTAEAADEVLVFERGRLVERGRHDDLLAQGGAYAALHADWAAGTTEPLRRRRPQRAAAPISSPAATTLPSSSARRPLAAAASTRASVGKRPSTCEGGGAGGEAVVGAGQAGGGGGGVEDDQAGGGLYRGHVGEGEDGGFGRHAGQQGPRLGQAVVAEDHQGVGHADAGEVEGLGREDQRRQAVPAAHGDGVVVGLGGVEAGADGGLGGEPDARSGPGRRQSRPRAGSSGDPGWSGG